MKILLSFILYALPIQITSNTYIEPRLERKDYVHHLLYTYLRKELNIASQNSNPKDQQRRKDYKGADGRKENRVIPLRDLVKVALPLNVPFLRSG